MDISVFFFFVNLLQQYEMPYGTDYNKGLLSLGQPGGWVLATSVPGHWFDIIICFLENFRENIFKI